MTTNNATHRGQRSAHDATSYYHIAAALPYINPTCALFVPAAAGSESHEALSSLHAAARHKHHKSAFPAITYKWTSRNNRKGRHAISINPDRIPAESKHLAPAPTMSLRKTLFGIWRMLTVFPVWDISYDVATIFTLGSIIWVINAFFVWLPLVRPSTEFHNESLYGGGITAFIGATVFEVGSFLLMAEAINENRTGCFGWALERALSHDSEKGSGNGFRLRPSESHCTHHHFNKTNLIGKGVNFSTLSLPGSILTPNPDSWIWFPTIEEIRTHYIRELGFLASFAQLIGASIFWISGFTALPGIYDKMSPVVKIVLFWTPQVIGGSGFIISGTLFMLETQSRWYKPAPKTLGWWIGAWNLIGGIGFTVCPAFGYDEASWAQYQSCLSTFWGSWAFLIGSVIQWYESLDKHPVEIDTSPVEYSDSSTEDIGNEGSQGA